MNLRPGQCEIKNISITDHKKSVVVNKDYPSAKMLEFVDTIDITESIFTSHIVADVTFNDGGNFKERFNISGDEEFIIEFQGYGSDVTLKYKLRVVEMSGVIPNSNLRSKVFKIRLASKELLIDSAHVVAKSYAASTRTILEDIIRKYLSSNKKLFIEDTKDPQKMIIPYLSPFQAIDFVRQRSVSAKYKSSTFLFFETSEQYNFATIEGLLERGSKLELQKFMQQEDVSQNVKGSQSSVTDMESFRLFSNYTVKDLFNLNNYFKNGGLQTVVSQYDFTTKKYTSKLFQNKPSSRLFYEFSNAKNPDISNTLFSEYSKYGKKPLLIPFVKYKDTTNVTNNYVYDTIAERICYANLFTHEKTYVDIPGNTRIHAGTIIELEIPKYDGQNSKKGKNTMDSGKYIVTSVRHSVKNADSSKYDSHLELMRFGKGVYEE